MIRKTNRVCLLAGLLATASGAAAALEIRTGMWEVQTGMRSPLLPQPEVITSTECITGGSFDPAVAMLESGRCTITDRQDTRDAVSWEFRCGGNGMPVTSGVGRFVTSGRSASGEMQLSTEFNGQVVTMTGTWTGRHLADRCD